MNLSRSMCLADNDDYCMLIMFTDIVMEEEKPPPNALDTKKLVFLFFFKKRVSLESNKAGDPSHTTEIFSTAEKAHKLQR